MAYLTDHLTKLTCAAHTARDLGYVHTGRALECLILEEHKRLKLAAQTSALTFADSKLRYDRSAT